QATAREQRTKVDWALEVAHLLDTGLPCWPRKYIPEFTGQIRGRSLEGLRGKRNELPGNGVLPASVSCRRLSFPGTTAPTRRGFRGQARLMRYSATAPAFFGSVSTPITSQRNCSAASTVNNAANCSLAKAQPAIVTGSMRAARLTCWPKKLRRC